MSILEVREGLIAKVDDDTQVTILLVGYDRELKAFNRMRRAPIIADGAIMPGPKSSRLRVYPRVDLSIVAWIWVFPNGDCQVHRYTSLVLFNEAKAQLGQVSGGKHESR